MITTLKELLFKVEMAPIKEKLGMGSISSTEYGIFGEIDGNTILLNTCSDVYELVPNEKIFPVIEKILKKGNIPFDVTYKMIDHSRFYADYTLKTGAVSVGNNKDKIYPVIRVTHSYNGLLKYKVIFGWFRLICGNGLVLPVEGKEEANVSIVGKHTKQILASLDQLMDKIKTFISNPDGMYTKKFETLANRWVNDWQTRIVEIMTVSGVGKRGYNQIEAILEAESDSLNGGRVNDWLIYNAFNYHIFNAKTSDGKEYATAPNLRYDQDKKVFDVIYKNKGNALTKLIEAKKELREEFKKLNTQIFEEAND